MVGIAGRLGRPLRGEQLGSYCPPQLFESKVVYKLYIKVGASKPSLQLLYEGPYNRVLRAGQKVFAVDIGGRSQSTV